MEELRALDPVAQVEELADLVDRQTQREGVGREDETDVSVNDWRGCEDCHGFWVGIELERKGEDVLEESTDGSRQPHRS